MDDNTQIVVMVILSAGFFGLVMGGVGYFALTHTLPNKIVNVLEVSGSPIYIEKVTNDTYMATTPSGLHGSVILPFETTLKPFICYELSFSPDALQKTVTLTYAVVNASLCR